MAGPSCHEAWIVPVRRPSSGTPAVPAGMGPWQPWTFAVCSTAVTDLSTTTLSRSFSHGDARSVPRMKWLTHQCMALMGLYALGASLPALCAGWAGSIAPDALDRRLAGRAFFRQRAFNKLHRGASHWPGWWLLGWAASQAGLLGPLPDSMAGGFALGALSHTLLDLCTTRGIPLLPFGKKRASLRICATGSFAEYAILAMTIIVFWLAMGRNALLPQLQV
ncbi:MAG: metal-dependent hydrolase [Desulfovibrio sp.]